MHFALAARRCVQAALLGLALATGLACGNAPSEHDAPAGASAADAPLPPAPAVPASPADAADAAANVPRGVTGSILRISQDEIELRDLGEGSGGNTIVSLEGDLAVPVSGLKKSWLELRRGDTVAISFAGDPPRALGINVLPLTLAPEIAAAAGLRDPYKKLGRIFVGWIKHVDAQTLAVRTPDGPPGSGRKGELKLFVRKPDTQVDMLRDSWEAMRNGDRVSVVFQKGEPRPIVRVSVILRGGGRPLPPGLATRLFDEQYDGTVRDVDGIGEWPPDQPWPPRAAAEPAR